MKKFCPVCAEPTEYPWRAALEHFRLYQRGQWKYLRGNVSCFGLLQGISGTLGLAFPIYNTLRHWKYRKYRLVIPEGSDVCITRGEE